MMEILKFNNNSDRPNISRGDIVNNIDEIVWIERYQEAGEFELKADASTNIHELLPPDTLIGTPNSPEVMMVETVLIEERKGESTTTITGRSLEAALLSRRVAGGHLSWLGGTGDAPTYKISAGPLWDQARKLAKHALVETVEGQHANNQIGNLFIIDNIPTGSGAGMGSVERQIPFANAYREFMGLLELEGMGVRVIRQDFPDPSSRSDDVVIELHKGSNKTGSIFFSHMYGDLESADYIWTNKDEANMAFVHNRHLSITTAAAGLPPLLGMNRKAIFVDTRNMFDYLEKSYFLITGNYTYVTNLMIAHARVEIAKHKRKVLSSATIKSDVDRYNYRTDYKVGDLVTVEGRFGGKNKMRVVEYAETWDSNGLIGHPTLEIAEKDGRV